MKVNVGDIVTVSTETLGFHVVEVDEIVEDVSEHCDLEGPGFFGVMITDEWGRNVAKDAMELCYTNDMVSGNQAHG